MVRSDVGSSGVIFTLDTETGFRDVASEAPTNYPEIAAALVRWGIDSISVNPSSLIGALKVVADAERAAAAAR
jgi:phosphoenolpyruvate synthase/pyruvate phosphate dikinase